MALQQYYEANTANTKDAIAQRAQTAADGLVVKNQQAEQYAQQNARPMIQSLVDLQGDPNQGMDMGKLAQAAQMYNDIEKTMPAQVRSALSTPNTYKDPLTGKTFQSNYDPERMAVIAKNAQLDKNSTTLAKEDKRGENDRAGEVLRQKGRMELQGLKNEAAKAIAQARAVHDKKLEVLIGEAYTTAANYAEQPDYDPAVLQHLNDRLNGLIQTTVASKPATITPAITEGGVANVTNRGETPPIQAPVPQPRQAAPAAAPIEVVRGADGKLKRN
jgi:hypothetical protein